ncbi:MAG: putative manganese-dependent inorganic diphosphatase [Herpetosiphon sp.]
MDAIYIFGHQNPDTDSICSAIAYAYLKNTHTPGHVAARLGPINRETRFVLDEFAVPDPMLLQHIYPRVQDVMTTESIRASTDATVYQIGTLLRTHRVAAIPIVDADGRAQGAVSERSLARSYLNELHVQNLYETPTALGKIVHTLTATLLVGSPETQIKGDALIGAMSPASMVGYIKPGDVVILGDRETSQEAAIERHIACLIVTGGFEPSAHIQELARERDVAIVVTPHDTFATARLINLSVPALAILESHVTTVSPDSLVNDVTQELLESELGVALVSDDAGRLVGILTKSNILARRRRRVILVDHSERSQSALGIEQADILEIIDHHRLGGLETAGPILAVIAPVGCTATLVVRQYREAGLEPPRPIAGLMLSAVLSDTMLLKSPTTTVEDRAAVAYLGQILGEDPMAFGIRMYNTKFDIASQTPTDIATNDLKTFQFGATKVGIGQVEVGDKTVVLAHNAEIVAAMRVAQQEHGFDTMLLMVTDILAEGTELLVVGQTRDVERAFGIDLVDHAIYLPGVLSRKKQIVPLLAGAL